MIKNLVFDLGGVFVDYNPEKTLSERFDKATCDLLLSRLFRNPVWREMDRGTLSAREAVQSLNGLVSAEVYSRVLEIVENWGDYMPVFGDMEELVIGLKNSGMKIYLLSNIPQYFYRIKDRIPALAHFDGFIISSDLKLLKPDAAIFEALLREFSLKAEESFFIDDTAENTEAALGCGFSAHRFDHSDIPALINALSAAGVSLQPLA